MIAIYKRDLSLFFSSLIGPLIIAFFLLINNLILWSDFSQFNILENSYASMNSFFSIAPILFLLLIPAISMKTFSEEYQTGTIEILLTKPVSNYEIVLGKYFAILTIIFFSICLTFISVITIYFLGEKIGNLDLAAIFGSYIGLLLISSLFISICVFSSSLSKNQISSFFIGLIISTFFYFGFSKLSDIVFLQSIDLYVQKLGISYHYSFMSKGLLLMSNFVYFITVNFLFIFLSSLVITKKNHK